MISLRWSYLYPYFFLWKRPPFYSIRWPWKAFWSCCKPFCNNRLSGPDSLLKSLSATSSSPICSTWQSFESNLWYLNAIAFVYSLIPCIKFKILLLWIKFKILLLFILPIKFIILKCSGWNCYLVHVAGICRNQAIPEMPPRQFQKCLNFPQLPRHLQKMVFIWQCSNSGKWHSISKKLLQN